MSRRVGANNRRKLENRKQKIRTGSKQIVKRLSVFICIALVALGVGFIIMKGAGFVKGKVAQSDFVKVKKIAIKGCSAKSDAQLMTIVRPMIPEQAFNIDKKRIRDTLENVPWIQNAKISVSLFGNVEIKIKERKAIVFVNKGRIFQVDNKGVMYPLQKGKTELLPVVSGLRDSLAGNGKRMITGNDMKRLVSFLNGLKKTDSSLKNAISQIHMKKSEFHLIFQGSAVEVIVDGPERLKLYKHVQEQIKYSSAASKINLCYQNLAFVTQDEIVREEKISVVSD